MSTEPIEIYPALQKDPQQPPFVKSPAQLLP